MKCPRCGNPMRRTGPAVKLPKCFGAYYSCGEDTPACKFAESCKEFTDEMDEFPIGEEDWDV